MTEQTKRLSEHPLAAELLKAYGTICEAAERCNEMAEESKAKTGVHKPLPVISEK